MYFLCFGAVGIRVYHQGGRWTKKKIVGQKPVNLGVAAFLPKQRCAQNPWSYHGAYPKPGRMVSMSYNRVV